MTFGWSKRTVLRAGFGAVIAVLIVSAFEAYRIQVSVSRQHLEMYRHFVVQDDALATLRRNVWLAGNYVRDFFIDSTAPQGTVLVRQLEELGRENESALKVLESDPRRKIAPQVRADLDEYLRVLRSVPEKMPNAANAEELAFVRREIIPWRGRLYDALRGITVADEQKLLDREGDIAEARRAATRRLVAMLGVGVLLSVLVARLSLRHSENLEKKAERHFAEVEKARSELKELSARLLDIEEEEKRRLSRELHDEIGQALALLQIEISQAAAVAGPIPDAHRARLERARSLIERTVQTVRNMSGLLRPALLDDLGLVPALQFQLEDYIRRSGMHCEFVDEGVRDDLPDSAKTCVYRIVQEALHNAEKHSGAKRVKVSVRQTSEGLTAEIVDDGHGFMSDPQGRSSRSSGLGLIGMRERAANAGGALAVESGLGQGTRVMLSIPLSAPKDNAVSAKEVPV